jgi:hypothetical protein
VADPSSAAPTQAPAPASAASLEALADLMEEGVE